MATIDFEPEAPAKSRIDFTPEKSAGEQLVDPGELGYESAVGAEPALREAEGISPPNWRQFGQEFVDTSLFAPSAKTVKTAAEFLAPGLGLLPAISPTARKLEEGAAQTGAELISGLATPRSLEYTIPVYGQAKLLGDAAEMAGTGAGTALEGFRQGDPEAVGRGLSQAGVAILPAAHFAKGSRAPSEAVRPPPIPKEIADAIQRETETPVRNVREPVGPEEGVREVPATGAGEEAGARSGKVSGAPDVPPESEVIPGEEEKGKEAEGVLDQPAVEPTAAPPELTGDAKAALGELDTLLAQRGSFSTEQALDLGDRFKTPEEISALKERVNSALEQLREEVKKPAATIEGLTAKGKTVALISKLNEVIEGAEKPADKSFVQQYFAKKKAAAPVEEAPAAPAKPESKGTLTFQGVQMGAPKYGMINPKTGRMIQYTAEEARKKGFEVSPEEEAKGKAAMEGKPIHPERFKPDMTEYLPEWREFVRTGNTAHLKNIPVGMWLDFAMAFDHPLPSNVEYLAQPPRPIGPEEQGFRPEGYGSSTAPKQLAAPEAKAQAEVAKVAATEGNRSAQEIKDDLIAEIQERLTKAPSETKPGDTVTIDIPGDGVFTVNNSVEALSTVLERAKKIRTDSVKTPRVLKNRRSSEAKAAQPPAAPPPVPPEGSPAAPGAPEPEGGSPLGITPSSGFSFTGLADTLKRAWDGITTAFRTSPNKDAMSAHMDAADNIARVSGQRLGNRVRLMAPSELDRKAMTFIIEAKDDPASLAAMLTKTTGKNLEASKAIAHAQANWLRLKPMAGRVSNIMEAQRRFEQASGIDTDNVEGYIKHAYDMDLMMGKNRPVLLSGSGGTGLSTAFKKQRAFETYADAIEAGYTPKSLDSSTLVNSRVAAGTKLVNRLKWGDALRGVDDPTSGKPIVTAMVTQPKGTQVAPAGYVTNEIIPGVRVAVHEGYDALFDALKGASKLEEFEVKGISVGELALKAEGAIKHGLLAFDTFHASRIMQKQLFLTGKVGWNKGKTLLEYSDRDLGEAVKQSLITPEMADYARANRPTANLLMKEGLNVGRISEALYADTVKNLPVIGKFNKWVFDKVTRGAMMESGIIEFDRVKQQNPELSDIEVARKVSKDLNFYFGNIGRQGLFRGKTMQDMARLVALAPQWVEGMVQTEVRSAGQLAKAPIDSVRAGQLRTGTLAKGVGQGLLAYFIGTQILNLATRKQFTWQNPEKDHKLDAFIPDPTGKSNGWFISPFSVVAEITHDMLRYGAKKDSLLSAAGQIIANKKSPLARSASVLFTGDDASGHKILGTWNRVKAAAWALAPTPIPLQPGLKGTEYPGQAGRQAAGSLGFKIEPAAKDIPKIVGKFNISNRAGFEEYLNSVAAEARKVPPAGRQKFIIDRLTEDEVAPRYRQEAARKLMMKTRAQ